MPARRDTRIEASRLRRLSPLQALENQSQTWGIRCHEYRQIKRLFPPMARAHPVAHPAPPTGELPWGVLTFELGGLGQHRDCLWFGHDQLLWYGQSSPLGRQPRLPVVAGILE